jgi:hypothetical protein
MTPAEIREMRRAIRHLRFALRWLLRRYDADAGDRHPARFHAEHVLENTAFRMRGARRKAAVR